MTEYLIAARAAATQWTSLEVMPGEIAFDAIEAELMRRVLEASEAIRSAKLSGTILLSERNGGQRLFGLI